jgi:hypothetical protein
MRIGRLITAGTLAVGAYRAYRHHKDKSAPLSGARTSRSPMMSDKFKRRSV